MITAEIRAEKKQEMDRLFLLTCDLWAAGERHRSDVVGATLHGFRDSFLGLDSFLFSYGLQLTALFSEFLVSDAKTFEAFAMLKACQAFKGLKPDPVENIPTLLDSPDTGSIQAPDAAENLYIADVWRSECLYPGGYVLLFQRDVAGWINELRDPQGWEPGVIAIDSDGNQWIAFGGNPSDGAESWNRLFITQSEGAAA